MEYTKLTKGEVQEYDERMRDNPLFKPNMAKIRTLSQTNPSIFAKWYLGITPFSYQDQALNDTAKRMIVCSSRQIGKTYVTAIKALHFAMFNEKKQILVFSKNANQAKKFIREMKAIIAEGQRYLNHKMSEGHSGIDLGEAPAWVLPEDIDNKKPNNTEEFTLTNGSIIRSLPATDSSRGYTADWVIVDEAAFVPDDIFEMVIEPTVRYSGGGITLLSTPNGQKGFFFKLFDPEDKREEHEYKRYWWDWRICPNENIHDMTLRKRADLDPLTFAQEYEAKFTSDAGAFFKAKNVKGGIVEELEIQFGDLANDYICGIDFGMSKSSTVVSLCYIEDETDHIILSYQKEYPGGYDNNNLIPELIALETRFKINQYVVDDCPQGQDVIKNMENKGWNVYKFKFQSEKVAAFFLFRAALSRPEATPGPKIKYPLIPGLLEQMYSMQVKDNKRGSFSIDKPAGGKDDRVDSLILACYPFIKKEEQEEFRSHLV